MIGLLIIAACCTIGLTIEVVRLLKLEVRSFKRDWFLRREAGKAAVLLGQAQRLHRLHPCRETRLQVVQAEAIRDLIAAARIEDWATAAAFKYQVETIDLLLKLPVEPSMDPRHQELVRMAVFN
jgi:hypothetical protein